MSEHPNDRARDHQADFPTALETGGYRAAQVDPDDVTGWARWHVHRDAEGGLVGIVSEWHEWLGDRYADATFTAVWNPTLGPFKAKWCSQGHADAHAALAALAAHIDAADAPEPAADRRLSCRCDRGRCRQNVYAVVTDATGEHVPVCASHLAGATVALDANLSVVESLPLEWTVASVTQLAYELDLCRQALRVATGRDAHDVAALVDTAITGLCAQAAAHAGRAGITLDTGADAETVAAVLGELAARDLAWAARLVDSARGGHVPAWLREIAADRRPARRPSAPERR